MYTNNTRCTKMNTQTPTVCGSEWRMTSFMTKQHKHTHTHTHTLARSIFPTEKADAVARVAANTASFMLDGVLDIYIYVCVTKGVQGIFHLKGRCQTQKKDLEMRVSEDFHVESFNSTKAREIIYDPLSGIRYPLVIYSLGSKTALHPSFTYISHSHHQS
jgi:hypothetical protein